MSKNSRQMLMQAQRERRAGFRYPVRDLDQREDLHDSYNDIADSEVKWMKLEKWAKGSSMVIEALDSLASKEDFTAASLRKPATNIRTFSIFVNTAVITTIIINCCFNYR